MKECQTVYESSCGDLLQTGAAELMEMAAIWLSGQYYTKAYNLYINKL